MSKGLSKHSESLFALSMLTIYSPVVDLCEGFYGLEQWVDDTDMADAEYEPILGSRCPGF